MNWFYKIDAKLCSSPIFLIYNLINSLFYTNDTDKWLILSAFHKINL